MEKVIVAEHLTRQVENRLLVSDLSFEIVSGTIFGLIGPPESGKTTTVRLLTGACYPTSGDAQVLGRPLSRYSERLRRRIGYMPERSAIYPDLTLWENLSFQASLYGMRPFRRRRFRELLNSLEIFEFRNKLAAELDRDLRRKLRIAAALVHNPDIVFLDEPFADLSIQTREELTGYIQALRSSGKTVFIASKSPLDAALCDQVALISHGRLVMIGTSDELRRKAFGGEFVDLKVSGLTTEHVSAIAALSFVQRTPEFLPDGSVRLKVEDAREAADALKSWCDDQNLYIQSVDTYVPPIDENFSASVTALYD